MSDATLARLSTRLGEVSQERDDLEAQVAELTEDLKNARRSPPGLDEDTKKQLTDKIAELSESLRASGANLNTTESEKAELEARLKVAQQQIQAERENVGLKADSDLRKLRGHAEQLQTEMDTASKRHQTALTQLKKERDSAEDSARRARAELVEAKATVKQGENSRRNLEEQNSLLASKLHGVEEQLDESRAGASRREAQVRADAQARCVQLEGKTRALEEELASAKLARGRDANGLKDLEQSCAGWESKVRRLEAEAVDAAALMRQETNLRKDAEHKCTQLESRLKHLEGELEAASSGTRQECSARQEAEQRCLMLESKVKQLEVELEDAEAAASRRESSLQQQHEQHSTQAQAKIRELSDELRGTNASSRQEVKARQHAEQELIKFQQKVQQLMADLEATTSSYKSEIAEREMLQRENSELRNKLSELEHQVETQQVAAAHKQEGLRTEMERQREHEAKMVLGERERADAAEGLVEELRARIDEQQETIQQLKTEGKSGQAALVQAQQAVHRLRTEALGKMSELVSEVEQLQSDLDKTKGELASANQDRNSYREKLSAAEADCEAAKNNAATVLSSLHQMSSAEVGLREELLRERLEATQLNDRWLQCEREWKERIIRLNSELESVRAERDGLVAECTVRLERIENSRNSEGSMKARDMVALLSSKHSHY